MPPKDLANPVGGAPLSDVEELRRNYQLIGSGWLTTQRNP